VLSWEDRIAADALRALRENNEEENAIEQKVADKHYEE